MKDPKDIVVQCGDCQWQGPSRDLIENDGLHFCPMCGREFDVFPPASKATEHRS